MLSTIYFRRQANPDTLQHKTLFVPVVDVKYSLHALIALFDLPRFKPNSRCPSTPSLLKAFHLWTLLVPLQFTQDYRGTNSYGATRDRQESCSAEWNQCLLFILSH
ncbi:hypothetical protein BDR07DRAFT_58003 [Suillus spraguei]|nr:hypothetical protein BDR07DRAFT_58003 [Suillus spraguei]